MGLFDILRSVTNHSYKINLKELPSQGYFYKDDFSIHIKKASIEDINEYELNYQPTIFGMISEIKKIIQNNCILSEGYDYRDIKSVDIIYLFFEIIKFTNKKPVEIYYTDNNINKVKIHIGPDTYNYFDFSRFMKYYNEEECSFNIDGYKYSVPSFGVENSITDFLVSRSEIFALYDSYSYDFRYFLSDKNHLEYDEIDNLLLIFNNDLQQAEQLDIKRIISKFDPIASFSLRKDETIIDVQSKISLKNIWK